MWTDDAACKFLGGVKAYQQRAVCKSGENNKWKRVVKCVEGNQVLAKSGLDYRTGRLSSKRYNYQQCKMYKSKNKHAIYLYMFGKCHHIPNMKTLKNMMKSGSKIIKLSQPQMNACPKGTRMKSGAKLYKTSDGAMFLRNRKMYQLEDMNAFKQCQFDSKKLIPISDEDFEKQPLGDIITS